MSPDDLNVAETKCPSKAYERARSTIVYRLSEAMFASLLATYIIGFISFLGPIWETARWETVGWGTEEPGTEEPGTEEAGTDEGETEEEVKLYECVFHTVSLLSVSLVFSFMTAAIYLIYNMSILTMASYDERVGSRDFVFAVSQGLLFGFAIVFPWGLAIAAGALLIVGIIIKYIEHGRLVSYFRKTVLTCKAPTSEGGGVSDHDRQMAKRIREEMKAAGFSEWDCPTFKNWRDPLLLIGFGITVVCVANHRFQDYSPLLVVTVLNAILAMCVMLSSFLTIRRSAPFMKRDERGEYPKDRAFVEFVGELGAINDSIESNDS